MLTFGDAYLLIRVGTLSMVLAACGDGFTAEPTHLDTRPRADAGDEAEEASAPEAATTGDAGADVREEIPTEASPAADVTEEGIRGRCPLDPPTVGNPCVGDSICAYPCIEGSGNPASYVCAGVWMIGGVCS
jgi:hypothetical protein